MNEVLKTIAAKYKDDIVHTASELIQRNSQSLHEGEVAAYVQEKMKELGYDKVEVDRYGNVFGTMKGTGGGSSVMLNCHMDVALPPLQRRDRRGPGLGPGRLRYQRHHGHSDLCSLPAEGSRPAAQG